MKDAELQRRMTLRALEAKPARQQAEDEIMLICGRQRERQLIAEAERAAARRLNET